MPTKKLYPYDFIYKSDLISEEILSVGVGNLLDELERIYVSAITNAKAIHNNGEYTVKGKQSKMKELLVDIRRQIKEFENSHVGYEKTIQQIKDSMQPQESRKDDIVGELRKQEIRTFLQKLDPLDAEVEYQAAADRGDYLFLDAVEQAPLPFRFVTQKQIDKISFQKMEREFPVEATKLRDLQRAQETVSSALKSVKAALTKDGLDLRAEDLEIVQAA